MSMENQTIYTFLICIYAPRNCINNDYNQVMLVTIDTVKKQSKFMQITMLQLKDALRNKKMKIENICYVASKNTIVGKDYALSLVCVNKLSGNALALYTTNNGKNIVYVYVYEAGFKLGECPLNKVVENRIVNIDDSGAVKCLNLDNNTITSTNTGTRANNKSGFKQLSEELVKKVYDKDYPLNVKEFKEFMDSKGWGYELTQTSSNHYILNYVDSNCNILHMPSNVKKSEYLFKSSPLPDTTIIFGREFSEISHFMPNIEGSYVSIKEIYFQYKENGETTGHFKGEGLTQLHIGKSNLPNYHTIENLYNNCEINNIEQCNYAYNTKVINSFNQIKNSNISINNRYEIEDSFINIYKCNIQFYIKQEKGNSNSIIRCFCNNKGCTTKVINATEKEHDVSPMYILDSFIDHDKSSIDIDDSLRVEKIRNSFVNCEKLRFNLENTGISYIQESFGDCGMDELIVPDTVSDMLYCEKFNTHPKVVFTGERVVLNKNIFRKYNKEIEIEYRTDSIRQLDVGMKLYSLPKTIKSINGLHIQLDGDTFFDGEGYNNIRKIERNMFYKCSTLRTILLGDKVRAISENNFGGCKSLKYIILGSKIGKIDKLAFNNINTKVITIYVVKGSKTYEALSQVNVYGIKQRLRVVGVESIDRARHIIQDFDNDEHIKIKQILNHNNTLHARYGFLEQSEESIGLYKYMYKVDKFSTNTDWQAYINQYSLNMDNVPSYIEDYTQYNKEKINEYYINKLSNQSPEEESVGKAIYDSMRKFMFDFSSVLPYRSPEYMDGILKRLNNCDESKIKHVIGYKDNMIIRLIYTNILTICVRNGYIEMVISGESCRTDILQMDRFIGTMKVLDIGSIINEGDTIRIERNHRKCLIDLGNMYTYIEDINDAFRTFLHNLFSQLILIEVSRNAICCDIAYHIFSGQYMAIDRTQTENVIINLNILRKFDNLTDCISYVEKYYNGGRNLEFKFGKV